MFFLCLVLVYVAFLTRTYYWDGILFSLNIEAVAQRKLPWAALFHPNHLLYSALGYVLYLACMACGVGLRAITVLQVLNVILGALAALVIFAVASRIIGSKIIAWFCCVLFAIGATWWKFSTDADVYILDVLLLLLAVLFATDSPPRVIPAAACHVLAMLFHELAVFAYFPLLTAILLYAQWTRAKRLKFCTGYVALTGVCVLSGYLLAYASTDHRVYPTLLSWASSYASDSTFTTSWKQLAGPYLSSYIKLFAGGKLAFLGDYLSIPVCAGLAASIAALVIGVVLLRRPKAVEPVSLDRRALTVLWVWLGSYGVFLTCWDAGSAFHKLFLWPAIVLLLGGYISRRQNLYARAQAFLAFALALAGVELRRFYLSSFTHERRPGAGAC